MIRLDGNSLAAFRGAGVAGTVQSVAGCELFGAARLPSWASPYSAAATRALKAQFPTQWPTIRDYGFSHPEIVGYMNAYAPEDAKIAYSLVPLDKWRCARMVNGYWDTGLKVTRENWNKIRYILDARPTTLNVGNNWWANGLGGGSTCCLHVGMNNGTGNYTNCQFTYANGYGDISTGVYGSYGNRYKWDFNLPAATYKVYDASGNIVCDQAATLRTPTADNTSGGITVGRWHQYNNINSGSTHSADTFACQQYLDGELIAWFIPFIRGGEMHILNLVTGQLADQVGTFTELIESPA